MCPPVIRSIIGIACNRKTASSRPSNIVLVNSREKTRLSSSDRLSTLALEGVDASCRPPAPSSARMVSWTLVHVNHGAAADPIIKLSATSAESRENRPASVRERERSAARGNSWWKERYGSNGETLENQGEDGAKRGAIKTEATGGGTNEGESGQRYCRWQRMQHGGLLGASEIETVVQDSNESPDMIS